MKVLLLGPRGQLGWELQRALAPIGELVALPRQASNGLVGDLECPEQLAATIRHLQPDVIVNAAAYTDVDRAESEPEKARRVNAYAPGIVAEVARDIGALLVHYSTDYVFCGRGTTPWREDDSVNPLNIYGQSKWEGEKAIRSTDCRHLIFRTSWVYAARGNNFMRTMMRLAAQQTELKVIDDQHGVPTSAELIADVTAHAIRAVVYGSSRIGTYHLAPSGETTWYAYAIQLIERARELSWPVKVHQDRIYPVSSAEFPTPAKRPANSRLDCSRIQAEFGLKMPEWQQGVERALMELLENVNGGSE